MNKQELELASKLLAANILDQARRVVPRIAADIMMKFDRGPKPNMRESAQIALNIEVQARAMYEIEDKVKQVKDGAIKTNNRPRRRRR